jgi:hypothetical protein
MALGYWRRIVEGASCPRTIPLLVKPSFLTTIKLLPLSMERVREPFEF